MRVAQWVAASILIVLGCSHIPAETRKLATAAVYKYHLYHTIGDAYSSYDGQWVDDNRVRFRLLKYEQDDVYYVETGTQAPDYQVIPCYIELAEDLRRNDVVETDTLCHVIAVCRYSFHFRNEGWRAWEATIANEYPIRSVSEGRQLFEEAKARVKRLESKRVPPP